MCRLLSQMYVTSPDWYLNRISETYTHPQKCRDKPSGASKLAQSRDAILSISFKMINKAVQELSIRARILSSDEKQQGLLSYKLARLALGTSEAVSQVC